MIAVSVIIPTRDRPHAVLDAVRSVISGTFQDFELLIIDQSTSDATRATLEPLLADSRIYYYPNRRPGYGAASSRNLGIVHSVAPLLAIIDDDVTVRPDWLSRIVADFATDPLLQFICGKLTAPPYDWRTGFTPAFDPDTAGILTSWTMPLHAAGANFAMRRTLLDAVGGYDEFCGPGSRLGASDDGDLAFRIARSGAKWKASSSIEVVHTHGFRTASDGAALLKRYQRGNGGNFGRFTRRGDIGAGIWFLYQQAREALTVVVPNVLRGRRPTRAGWIMARLRGFVQGLMLSPDEGFVSGAELARRRKHIDDASSCNVNKA